MSHSSRKQGFTLIELLVVVVIIGLLSTMATAAYLRAQKIARDNTRKTDISSIATAIESYYSIKKSFPGSASGTALPALINCENADTVATGNLVYYYYPLDSTSPDDTKKNCGDRTSATIPAATKSLFKPAPNWIPGLSEFINPVPIDKTFVGADGTQSGAYSPVETASDSSATNKTRTYVYRHLNGGYAVYTRLENPDPDGNIVSGDITTKPTLQNVPGSGKWSITGGNVYMIRK